MWCLPWGTVKGRLGNNDGWPELGTGFRVESKGIKRNSLRDLRHKELADKNLREEVADSIPSKGKNTCKGFEMIKAWYIQSTSRRPG